MPFDGETWTRGEHRLALLRFAREGAARDRGWCQGELTIGASHCALGWLSAARRALGTPVGWHGPADFARRFMMDDLMDFNDSPYTTQADVVAVFDATIARLEGGTDAV